MNHLRVYMAISLVLIGILIVPVSFIFGESKLTELQKAALRSCGTKRTA